MQLHIERYSEGLREFFLYCSYFETRSYFVVEADLQLAIFQPACWLEHGPVFNVEVQIAKLFMILFVGKERPYHVDFAIKETIVLR